MLINEKSLNQALQVISVFLLFYKETNRSVCLTLDPLLIDHIPDLKCFRNPCRQGKPAYEI
jgi:hypothetical protein